jgi:hypothetical protein
MSRKRADVSKLGLFSSRSQGRMPRCLFDRPMNPRIKLFHQFLLSGCILAILLGATMAFLGDSQDFNTGLMIVFFSGVLANVPAFYFASQAAYRFAGKPPSTTPKLETGKWKRALPPLRSDRSSPVSKHAVDEQNAGSEGRNPAAICRVDAGLNEEPGWNEERKRPNISP